VAAPSDGQADIGNQFRVGIRGTRTGRVAGSASWPTPAQATPIYTDFIANGISAVKTTGAKSTGSGSNGTATSAGTGGYEVVVFVPFTEKENAAGAASDVFSGTPKQVIDGAEIGLELQLNTSIQDGTNNRDGILTWNGVTTGSYAHAENYGLVELNLDGKTRVVNAERPTITTQPAGNFVVIGQPYTLTVAANVTSGDLTYEWFKAANKGAAGTSLGAGTAVAGGSSIALTTAAADASYYYVVVTNTDNSATGVKIVSITSSSVLVTIGEYTAPATWVERITSVNNALPVYGFNLPDGKTFADYDRVVYSLKLDVSHAATVQGRARAWGDFGHTHGSYNAYTNPSNPINIQNATPAGLLLSTTYGAENYTPDVWVTKTAMFNNRDALNESTSIKAADGLIILALGMFPGDAAQKTWHIKDIYLSDGTNTIPALYPEHPLLWGGNGANAYGTDGNSNALGLVRELYDDGRHVIAPVNDTLFAPSGAYATGTPAPAKFDYDGKKWWIFGTTGGSIGPADWTVAASTHAPFDGAEATAFTAIKAAAANYTRVNYNLSTISTTFAADFAKVTITYDLIPVYGDVLTLTTRVGDGSGGAPNIVENQVVVGGTGKTFTSDTSLVTGNFAIVKRNSGDATAFLMRITKISLHD